ncbi:tetratricopeptide repeat protein [Cardiobacterium hominis]
MNDNILANLQRALRFTFKSGNIIYIVGIAVILSISMNINASHMLEQAVTRQELTPSLFAMLVQMVAGVILICKVLDNTGHLRLGLDNEEISLNPVSVVSLGLPLRYTGIIMLFGFATGIIAAILGNIISNQIVFGAFIIVLFLLTPAMLLAMLETETAGAAFSSRPLAHAISEIGTVNYIVALLIAGITFLIWWGVTHFWLEPALQQKLVGNLLEQAFSGKKSFSLPMVFYIYSFISSLSIMLLAFFNHHFYATFFPREDDEDGEYGMDISDREGITATLAEHGVSAAPQAEKKAAEPLPDFSLLTDADTSNMGIEAQKAFALALTRADALLTSNKIDAGLELLAPFADEAHDAAAYFPAYQRIYALKPQYDLLHRLIAAAARGHQPSFDLIRPELERIDPATLPADSVLPLAQFAARQQHYKTVLAITRQFAKNHPDHPQLIDNYILAARALAKSGAEDKAQQLLQQMLARFPDHAKAAQIRHTLKLLQEKT